VPYATKYVKYPKNYDKSPSSYDHWVCSETVGYFLKKVQNCAANKTQKIQINHKTHLIPLDFFFKTLYIKIAVD
jgi:hypothetical protein